MALAADLQRERVVAALRRHFVQGRLSVEELSARTERALAARTTDDLQSALRDLPRVGDMVERARGHVGLVLTLSALAAAWAVVTFVLLATMAIAAVFSDAGRALLLFPLAWLLLSGWALLTGRRAVRRHRAATRVG